MELADYSECNVMVLMMENNVILFSGGMNGDGCRAQLYHCLLIFKTSSTRQRSFCCCLSFLILTPKNCPRTQIITVNRRGTM